PAPGGRTLVSGALAAGGAVVVVAGVRAADGAGGGVVPGSVMRVPSVGPPGEGCTTTPPAAPRVRPGAGARARRAGDGDVGPAPFAGTNQIRFHGSAGGTGVRPALSALVRSPGAFGPTLGPPGARGTPASHAAGRCAARVRGWPGPRRRRTAGTRRDEARMTTDNDPAAVAELDRLDSEVRAAAPGDTTAQV